ncbi:MAG: hypothetical protein LZ168_02425 [Thaumarchaeota archaeon]|jgi:hypothetical protein|nr:hypothetical protein [Candidatus Geocrenenecus arthurdayi]
MWKKITLTGIAILLLSLAFLLFPYNLPINEDVIAQLIQNFRQIISIKEPEYVRLTISLMEVDLGHSMKYLGNESAPATPIRHTYVRIGGVVSITNDQGKAYLILPKGNHTLLVMRRGLRGPVWVHTLNVLSDGEVKITFHLFRLEASSMVLYPEPFKGTTNLKITFTLPLSGQYYVGKPTITYYTAWGELRILYRDIEVSDSISLQNVWSLIDMDYSRIEAGGQTIEFTEEVRGFPTYIHPKLSFIPIEKVEVEERWLS